MFSITQQAPNAAKGFQITLANGYKVSVQWGAGNYCENYSIRFEDFTVTAPNSATAETAIIAPDGSFVRYKGDDVQGWQTPEDVIATLAYAASL